MLVCFCTPHFSATNRKKKRNAAIFAPFFSPLRLRALRTFTIYTSTGSGDFRAREMWKGRTGVVAERERRAKMRGEKKDEPQKRAPTGIERKRAPTEMSPNREQRDRDRDDRDRRKREEEEEERTLERGRERVHRLAAIQRPLLLTAEA
jgi:hypothetical protein